jgi:3-hydroxyacyl-CoA dehydrogenase
VKLLAVIGSGQMGSGIAQVAASVAKIPVIIVDKDAQRIQNSMQFMGTFCFI